MRCYFGDCREVMQRLIDEGVKVQMCVTSPPYFGLRDYGVEGQIGLEQTPDEYVANMVEVFRLVRELLADDGTVWLNLGDSYIATKTGNPLSKSTLEGGKTTQLEASRRPDKKCKGLKPKDLIGIPWRVAFALQQDGWYLRSDIIWNKPNPMPESVRDRPTKSHEYLFLLSKQPKYYYDAEAIKEPCRSGPSDMKKMVEKKDRIGGKHKTLDDPLSKASQATNIGNKRGVGDPSGRNKRSVWEISTVPYPGAHFACFPPSLVEPCILAGSKTGDIVFDPFIGSGTTAMVAEHLGRKWIGIDLNPSNEELQKDRLRQPALAL